MNPLREGLKKQGVSVQDFAEELGISPSSAYNWVRGKVRPSHSNRRRVARFLDLSLVEFIKKWNAWEKEENS